MPRSPSLQGEAGAWPITIDLNVAPNRVSRYGELRRAVYGLGNHPIAIANAF